MKRNEMLARLLPRGFSEGKTHLLKYFGVHHRADGVERSLAYLHTEFQNQNRNEKGHLLERESHREKVRGLQKVFLFLKIV